MGLAKADRSGLCSRRAGFSPRLRQVQSPGRHLRASSTVTFRYSRAARFRARRRVGHLAGYKIQASALVGRQRHLDRPACSAGALAAATVAHRQPIRVVDPLNPLLVQDLALTPQHHVQPAVAKPSSLLGQGGVRANVPSSGPQA